MYRTILVYGLPHSGKSTIATAIASELGATRLDVGELLRRIIAQGEWHPRYNLAKRALLSNQLLDDFDAASLISAEIEGHEQTDIVIVGFPRTIRSLSIFFRCMRKLQRPESGCCVIYIQINESLSRDLTLKRYRAGDADAHLINARYEIFRENDLNVIKYLRRKLKIIDLNFANGLEVNIANALNFVQDL